MLKASDYYPFGMPLNEYEARRAHDYRYDYQGQYAEKDEETSWNHFQLREYDPVIGRWLVPDPAREFSSPYRTGNNPLNKVDPTGGCEECPKEAKAGDVWTNQGDQFNGTYEFIDNDIGWVRLGGSLNTVTVSATRSRADKNTYNHNFNYVVNLMSDRGENSISLKKHKFDDMTKQIDLDFSLLSGLNLWKSRTKFSTPKSKAPSKEKMLERSMKHATSGGPIRSHTKSTLQPPSKDFIRMDTLDNGKPFIFNDGTRGAKYSADSVFEGRENINVTLYDY